MRFKYFIVGLIFNASSFFVRSQTITLLSAKDNTPVPFAHVSITPINHTGEQQFFLSDSLGKITFHFTNASNENAFYKITFSSIGFEKRIDTTNFNYKTFIYYLTPQSQNLNEVVITGQYAPGNPEKAVHRITIIDAKEIEAQAAVNLRDVLSHEMNIRLSQDNILGSSMTMQGISGENVKILIDGVPVIGRLDGNIDISQINLNNIQRIEIIEGPMSVSYGTNALAGTINLITKKNLNSTFETGVSTYYESIGNYNFNGRIGFSKNKNTITLSGGRNYFNGWNDGEKFTILNKPQLADSSRYQSWKPKEQYFTNLQYGYVFNQLTLNFTSSFFKEKITNRGLPRAPYGETAFDDYYNTTRFDNAVFLHGEIANRKYLSFLFSYNDYIRKKNTYFKNLTTLQEVLSENESDQDTSHFNLINTRATFSSSNPLSNFSYEVGYDINIENGFGIRIKDNHQMIGDYALFSTAEYAMFNSKSLIIRPGIRFAYNTSYNSPVIPSLNLKYGVNNLTFRASYARGFRAPSLKELYYYFVDINHNILGNEDLKAEYSHNFNVSGMYMKGKDEKKYKAELSMFYNSVQNMITLAENSNTEYMYVNIGTYKTAGMQLDYEYSFRQLKFLLGGSYMGYYNQLSESTTANTFLYSPELRSNIMYEITSLNITAALFYKYSGSLPGFIVDENNILQQTVMDDYHIADFTLSKLFLKKQINISIGSKNLFNVKNLNSTSQGFPHSGVSNSIPFATGRTYFIKLDLNFNSNQ